MIDQNLQKKIKKMYLANNSVKIISEQLNLSYSKVFNFIKSSKLDEIRIELLKSRIIEMCRKEYTRHEISEELNLSLNQLNSLVKRYEIKHNFRGVEQKRLEDKILHEYQQNNLSIKEMCYKFKVSDAKVRRIYNKYNLKKVRQNQKKSFLVLTDEMYQQLIQDLKMTDESYSSLSKKYGISRQRIGQIKKKNEIIRIKDKV